MNRNVVYVETVLLATVRTWMDGLRINQPCLVDLPVRGFLDDHRIEDLLSHITEICILLRWVKRMCLLACLPVLNDVIAVIVHTQSVNEAQRITTRITDLRRHKQLQARRQVRESLLADPLHLSDLNILGILEATLVILIHTMADPLTGVCTRVQDLELVLTKHLTVTFLDVVVGAFLWREIEEMFHDPMECRPQCGGTKRIFR